MIKLEFVIERKEREKSVVLCFEIKTFKYFTFCSVSRPHLHSLRENKTKRRNEQRCMLFYLSYQFVLRANFYALPHFGFCQIRKLDLYFITILQSPNYIFLSSKTLSFVVWEKWEFGRSRWNSYIYGEEKPEENAVALAQNSKTHSVK